MRVHSSEKPYKCDECDYSTWFSRGLETHRSTRHNATSQIFKCDHPKCQYSTRAPLYLRRHKNIHVTEKSVKCDVCQRVFKNKYLLLAHSNVHTKKNLFKCQKCRYSSKFKSAFVAHLAKHVKEKTHKCEECGSSYHLEKELKKHQLNHDVRMKKFKCNRCQYRTHKKIYLNRHFSHSHSHKNRVITRINKEPKDKVRCRLCGLWLRDQSESRAHVDAHRPCFVLLPRMSNIPSPPHCVKPCSVLLRILPKKYRTSLLRVKIEID